MPAIEPVIAGGHFSRAVVLGNLNGATYTGSATLAASLWPGDGQAESFAPTVAWEVVGDLSVRITATAAQTATLAPGDYPVMVSVTEGGVTQREIACLIRVAAAPGEATAPPVYCTTTQLYDAVPWIQDLQSPEDQAGFAEARGAAREWLDAVIVSRTSAGSTGRWIDYSGLSVSRTDRNWVQDQLDADRLVLTGGDGKRLVRAACLYAASDVLRHQLGDRGEDSYQALADTMRREAEAIVTSGWAWLDLDDDGTADYPIDLSQLRIGRG